METFHKDELLSVVVPIYNVEKYLSRCIDSIINQTYSDLEIILVDDGSTDNCLSICKEYARKDARIKVIHKENGGISSARNAGIRVSSGEYISFIDSDDYIERQMYMQMMECIKLSGADICTCDIMHCNENGVYCESVSDISWDNRMTIYNYDQEKILSGIVYPFLGIKKESTEAGYFNSVVNKIFRATIIFENNIKFNEKLRIGEDSIFVLYFLVSANTYSYLKKSLYCYCMRNGSLSRTVEYDLFTVKCKRFEIFKSLFPEIYSDKEQNAKRFFSHEIECLKHFSIYMSYAQYKEALKELWESDYLKSAYMDYPNFAPNTELLQARKNQDFNAYCKHSYAWNRKLRIKRKIPKRPKKFIKKIIGRG